jgi:cytochrome P450
LGSRTSFEERARVVKLLDDYLREIVALRTRQPGDDPISMLLRSQVDGKPLSEQTVINMGNLLFMGGLDTVTNAMSYITRYLAEHPDQQAFLRHNPQRIQGAVEELMRRVAFVHTGRVVTHDVTFKGVRMKAGDRIIGSLCAASLDPRYAECPARVDFERHVPAHLAFNTGPHNCAGSHLARLELRTWLGEWLGRMPEFRLKEGFVPSFRRGQVMGMESLEIVW